MKKLFAYAFLFLSLAFLLPGCEKDLDPIEPIDQSKPALEVNVLPETVNQGGQAILVYKVTGADELFLNGEILYKTSDSILLENLQINRDLIFLAKNKYGENMVTKKITVIPNTPSITMLVANPQTLPIGGGETVITWTSNQYTKSVEYNGTTYPANGSLSVSVVTDSTRLTFIAKGNEGQRASSILIRVEQAPPPLTTEELFCLAPWKRSKLEFQSSDPSAPWVEASLGIDLLDDIITYYLNPQKVVVDFGEIRQEGLPRYSQGPWSISNDTLIDGETLYQFFVDEDSLVLVYTQTLSAEKVRETYIH